MVLCCHLEARTATADHDHPRCLIYVQAEIAQKSPCKHLSTETNTMVLMYTYMQTCFCLFFSKDPQSFILVHSHADHPPLNENANWDMDRSV